MRKWSLSRRRHDLRREGWNDGILRWRRRFRASAHSLLDPGSPRCTSGSNRKYFRIHFASRRSECHLPGTYAAHLRTWPQGRTKNYRGPTRWNFVRPDKRSPYLGDACTGGSGVMPGTDSARLNCPTSEITGRCTY